MAESRRYGLGPQLDIEQILLEAQHRWLRPAEICEILQNYKRFRIAPEPANKPPSGSLFLFDRKVLRYFRKDGHNWRKKKDGKTVKEAHERLKAGSVDVLHCYYAHGEDNENFQRRSYWLLEEERSHIVLVHYREVKGNRTNYNRVREAEESIPNSVETEETRLNSEVESSVSSKLQPYSYQVTPQTTDTTSLSSAHTTEYEDAESAYNQQPSSSFYSFLEQPPLMGRKDDALSTPYYPAPFPDDYQGKYPPVSETNSVSLAEGDKGKNSSSAGLTYEPWKQLDLQSWENLLQNNTSGIQSAPFQSLLSSAQPDTENILPGRGNEILGQIFTDAFGEKHELGNYPQGEEEWQTSESDASHISKWSMDQKLDTELAYDFTNKFHGAEQNNHGDLQIQLRNVESGNSLKPESESNLTGEKSNYSPLKPPLLSNFMNEGLKKLDSFDRWMSKELGDVNESKVQSSSGSYWEVVGSEDGIDDSSISPQVRLDTYMSPSLSQDQLFSIIDFSPNWASSGANIKVLITGRFLKSQQDLEKCKWACMFGELEVPAEVVADGVLRCHTPDHKPGRVPFYVTCSNRVACSEVREFEFQDTDIQDVDVTDISGGSNEVVLHMRFGKFLSLQSSSSQSSVDPTLSSKISSLLEENDSEWDQMAMFTSELEKVRDRLLQRLLKEKLYAWLLHKAGEGGKGPSVLDEGGQGVLHFAAALGYDWAIEPTIAAGVSINFRDVNGWTALHWAASYGRERTVGFLISLGADPGALTDPTPQYPSGRPPADLASSNGHKGIAGYLAESALSYHLSSLGLKDIKEADGLNNISNLEAVQSVSGRTASPINDGDLPDDRLSMKDSLAAVCNATQAAARIHQVFRVQSFQKKQLKEYGNDGFGISDERALSLLAVKKNKAGQRDEPVHAAAIRIQNKFRSYKGRKDFLIIRQRIVKIQAHVRGHQVRKNYKKITWSVGILEKVILRWRRKGSGLRGFKPEAITEGGMQSTTSSNEDEYDFLKEGRKQTEERLQKALARVKSMVQYPEARDQYRRLLNVVTDIQETKAVNDMAMTSSEEVADFDDLIDLQALLDDDTFMSSSYN
ncbi:hypothetical protein LguiA_003197 [Lonicera macranthoides]